MKIPKEIKIDIEKRRKEMKEESDLLKSHALANRICPICGKHIEDNRRIYCSDICSRTFYSDHDYSQKSEHLRQYKKKLMKEYTDNHPEIEEPKDPWSEHKARKTYECIMCHLEIEKGEKYAKFTILPGIDDFIDDPFLSFKYHPSCKNFMLLAYKYDLLPDEGFDEDEGEELYAFMSELLEMIDKELKLKIRKNELPLEKTFEELFGKNTTQEHK